MAEIIWTEPALADLDAIADYIALDNSDAARILVARVFAHVEQLAAQPESGSHPRELGSHTRYRQIVEPPCRVFYRYETANECVFILYVMRGEQQLRRGRLIYRDSLCIDSGHRTRLLIPTETSLPARSARRNAL